MKSVVLLSGGVDSTYTLWKELTTTTNDVTVIFICSEEAEKSGPFPIKAFTAGKSNRASRIASQNIIDWLKSNTRDFTYIIHSLDKSYLLNDPNKSDNPLTYIIRYLAKDFNSGKYDQLIISYEKDNDGFCDGGTIGAKRQPAAIPAIEEFKELCTRGSIMFPLIDSDYSQAFSRSELPPDLFKLTLSCEFTVPENPYKICGTCKRCVKRDFFKYQENLGKTPQEIHDFVKTQSILPNNQYWSFKNWCSLYIKADEFPVKHDIWEMPQWPTSYTIPEK